jgi:hypothetical protein
MHGSHSPLFTPARSTGAGYLPPAATGVDHEDSPMFRLMAYLHGVPAGYRGVSRDDHPVPQGTVIAPFCAPGIEIRALPGSPGYPGVLMVPPALVRPEDGLVFGVPRHAADLPDPDGPAPDKELDAELEDVVATTGPITLPPVAEADTTQLRLRDVQHAAEVVA